MNNSGNVLQDKVTLIVSTWTWLKNQSPWIIVLALIVILVWIISSPDRYKQLRSLICGIAAIFGFFKRQAVSSNIEAIISRCAELLNRELGEGVLPKEVKVQWVGQNQDRDSFIKGGKIVVKMSYTGNSSQNLINVCMAYLNEVFIPQTRPYIDTSLVKTSELMIAKKFLSKKSSQALNLFVQDVLNPILETDEQLRSDSEKLEILDAKGMFAQLFLPEIIDIGNYLYPTPTTPELRKQTRDLLEFLVAIATKDQGEEVPLEYSSPWFNVVLVLPGKKETIETRGLTPYIDYITESINNRFSRIYVMGIGKKINIVEDVVKCVSKDPRVINVSKRDTEVVVHAQDGLRKLRGVCYQLKTEYDYTLAVS